jgi:hypothetical protein
MVVAPLRADLSSSIARQLRSSRHGSCNMRSEDLTMASQHATGGEASKQAESSKQAASSASRRPGEGGRVRRTGATSERDDTYGLISVIYHSLQGAETCAKYEEDARRSKDEELVSFFEQCRADLDARAVRGRRLLAARIEGLDDEDDDDLMDDGDALIGGRESD